MQDTRITETRQQVQKIGIRTNFNANPNLYPGQDQTYSQMMHRTPTMESKRNQMWRLQKNIEMSTEILNSKTGIKPTEVLELAGSFYPFLKMSCNIWGHS